MHDISQNSVWRVLLRAVRDLALILAFVTTFSGAPLVGLLLLGLWHLCRKWVTMLDNRTDNIPL